MKSYLVVIAAVAALITGCNQENASNDASKSSTTSTSSPSTTTTAAAPPAAAPSTASSFCRIKLASKICAKPGRFDADGIYVKDAYKGANKDPKACLDRAKDYAFYCATDQPVIAEFVKDGQVAESTTFTRTR